MIRFLAHLFIKNDTDYTLPKTREAYGILSGMVGIVFNIILFIGKFIAGTLSGSISITADSFNNLSDAGSSVVTMVGFKLSGQKPDPEHPFGHGRFEYLTGLIVSMLIILMGFELVKSSFTKILSPSTTSFSPLIAAILLVSIAVKLYMFSYNNSLSKKLSSVAMKSTAMDSLSDSIATTVVLISQIFSVLTSISIDGWCGLAVSGFILYTGITSAIDTINPLLGTRPDPAFVTNIKKIVNSYDGILGVHDLIVHDYGPGRRMISLHAEVPADDNIIKAHELIDSIEMRLNAEFHMESVIHMDPILVNDPETNELRKQVAKIIKNLDASATFHDFRIVPASGHTNVLFDVVVPFTLSKSDEEVVTYLKDQIAEISCKYRCMIHVDKKYD